MKQPEIPISNMTPPLMPTPMPAHQITLESFSSDEAKQMPNIAKLMENLPTIKKKKVVEESDGKPLLEIKTEGISLHLCIDGEGNVTAFGIGKPGDSNIELHHIYDSKVSVDDFMQELGSSMKNAADENGYISNSADFFNKVQNDMKAKYPNNNLDDNQRRPFSP